MKILLLALAVCLTMPVEQTYKRTLSVYSDGSIMANGERYNPNGLTVASNDFPLGTKLHIKCGKNSVTVRVTDRMAKRFTGKRIDGSRRVWKILTDGAAWGLRPVVVTKR